MKFCEVGGFRAVPAAEPVLCRFVAHSAEGGLRYTWQSICGHSFQSGQLLRGV